MTLVWSDEFDGTSINLDNWTLTWGTTDGATTNGRITPAALRTAQWLTDF